MEWLSDSRACLAVAYSMLENIKNEYREAILKDNTPSTLNVTIKNFLENVRSSLEYSTHYIFTTHCSIHYNAKELERKNVYFPIRKTQSSFDECINSDFRGLRDDKPEIYQILKSCQSFNGQMWAQHLATLSNKNKHIKLTKQKKKNKIVNIVHGKDFFDNNFKNVVFEDCNVGLSYNDKYDQDAHIFFKDFNMKVEFEYLFEDINQPVIPTLQDIYSGANLIISKLSNCVL
jgi:hypothetical protein